MWTSLFFNYRCYGKQSKICDSERIEFKLFLYIWLNVCKSCIELSGYDLCMIWMFIIAISEQ